MRRHASGTGCGCLRARLVTSHSGGDPENGPCGTTTARPAGADKCRVNEPRLRKLVWVVRREASALIAKRAYAFARRAADRSQDPLRVPRKHPAPPGAPFPHLRDGNRGRAHPAPA